MGPNANPSPEDPKRAETVVRALLEEWAQRIDGNPVPDFAQQISIVSIRDRTAYAGFLRCLFDVRTGPEDKMLPYRPEAPLKAADKSDPWSLPVGLSRQFLEQEETFVGADPGEPLNCTLCSGENPAVCDACAGGKTVPCDACGLAGRKSCPNCQGRGKTACTLCAGAGKVVQSVSEGGVRNETVCPECAGKKEFPCRECADAAATDCARCGNKRVMTCPKCEGRGTPVCAQCGGSRMIARGFRFQIAYKIAYYRSVVRDPAVPEAVFPQDPPLGKLGRTLLESETEDAASLAAKKPEGPAGEAFSRVLAMVPEAGLGPNSRRILQAISVEEIPVYEVVYAFQGKEYRAWASRFENRVVAVDDPFSGLAGRWAAEAEALLAKGELEPFEALAAKAVALAPRDPAVAALRGKAGAVQRRAAVLLGAGVSAFWAVAVPVALGFLYKSPSRFEPLAALALASAALSLGLVYWRGARLAAGPLVRVPRRNAEAVGAASAGAVLAAVFFLIVAPIRRIDIGEFQKKLADLEARPLESWTPDDDSLAAQLIKDYSARGVDVSDAQNLRDQYAAQVAAAHAKALADAQARRAAEEWAKEQREEAARRAKALAAAKRAAKLRAAKKKKKKKRKTWS